MEKWAIRWICIYILGLCIGIGEVYRFPIPETLIPQFSAEEAGFGLRFGRGGR